MVVDGGHEHEWVQEQMDVLARRIAELGVVVEGVTGGVGWGDIEALAVRVGLLEAGSHAHDVPVLTPPSSSITPEADGWATELRREAGGVRWGWWDWMRRTGYRYGFRRVPVPWERDDIGPEVSLLVDELNVGHGMGIGVVVLPYYYWEADMPERQPPLVRTLKHVRQLAPVYNHPAVLAVCRGFVHRWGEGGSGVAQPLGDSYAEVGLRNRGAITQAVLAATSKVVLVRYPREAMMLREMGVPIDRLGCINDALGWNPLGEAGLYSDWDGSYRPWGLEAERAWYEQESRATFGEAHIYENRSVEQWRTLFGKHRVTVMRKDFPSTLTNQLVGTPVEADMGRRIAEFKALGRVTP